MGVFRIHCRSFGDSTPGPCGFGAVVEELGTFLAVVDGMFTNNEPQLEVENPTDRMYTSSISKAVAELKWSIHDEEQNLMGDELLYSSFCRQPPRVVRIARRNVSVSSQEASF